VRVRGESSFAPARSGRASRRRGAFALIAGGLSVLIMALLCGAVLPAMARAATRASMPTPAPTSWTLASSLPQGAGGFAPVTTVHGSRSIVVWSVARGNYLCNLWSATAAAPWGGWPTPALLDTQALSGWLFNRLVTGAGGETALVWLRQDDPGHVSLHVRLMSADAHEWGPDTTLVSVPWVSGGPEMGDFRVWVAPSGAVTVAWMALKDDGGPEPIMERSWDPLSAAWSAARVISDDAHGALLSLTGAANGEVTAAWNHWWQYDVSTLEPGATAWTAPLDLAPGGWTFGLFRNTFPVVTNHAGTTVAAWSEYTTGGSASGNILYVCVRPAGSTEWGSPVPLVNASDADFNYDPQLVLDANDRFLLVAGTYLTATTRSLAAFSADSTAQTWDSSTLVPSVAWTDAFEVAGDAQGGVVVLFDRGGSVGYATTSLYATERVDPSASWSSPELLSVTAWKTGNDAGGVMQVGGYPAPQLVVTPDGIVAATWRDAAAVKVAYSGAQMVAPTITPKVTLKLSGLRYGAMRLGRSGSVIRRAVLRYRHRGVQPIAWCREPSG